MTYDYMTYKAKFINDLIINLDYYYENDCQYKKIQFYLPNNAYQAYHDLQRYFSKLDFHYEGIPDVYKYRVSSSEWVDNTIEFFLSILDLSVSRKSIPIFKSSHPKVYWMLIGNEKSNPSFLYNFKNLKELLNFYKKEEMASKIFETIKIALKPEKNTISQLKYIKNKTGISISAILATSFLFVNDIISQTEPGSNEVARFFTNDTREIKDLNNRSYWNNVKNICNKNYSNSKFNNNFNYNQEKIYKPINYKSNYTWSKKPYIKEVNVKLINNQNIYDSCKSVILDDILKVGFYGNYYY